MGRLMLVSISALLFAAQQAAADPSRCERLFDETSEIQTCDTLLGLREETLSDEELRESVSRQIYGVGYEDALKLKQRRLKEREEVAEEVKRDQASKTDQCGRVFSSQKERDICRWQSVFLSSRLGDEELKKSVQQIVEQMQSDPAYNKHVLLALRQTNADEAERRLYEKEIEKIRATEERERTARARREARRERERADLARAEAERTSTILRQGKVGFLPETWKLGGFGTVLVARFVLQNNTREWVKDFQVGCETAGDSGTRLSAVTGVLYSRLRPGEQRTFEMNFGQVHPQSSRVSCRLIGWK